MKPKCIWCEIHPAGGFFLDDLCPKCEKLFAELSAQDSTYAENDSTGAAR